MVVYDPNLDITSKLQFEFPLLVKTQGLLVTYTPKSDASLWIGKFPHLLLEVVSDQAHSDRHRMLLQAKCLAKFGNALRRNSRSDPFVISAIYINERLYASWYLVYQADPLKPEVRLISQEAVCYLHLSRSRTWRTCSIFQISKPCSSSSFNYIISFRTPRRAATT